MKTLCLLLLPLLATAQESILPQPGPKTETFGRQWTVSVSLGGWQGYDPSETIVQKMKETGWVSKDPGGCFIVCSDPTDFPRVLRFLPFDLELGYRKSGRRGILVGLGFPLNIEITGRAPDGGFGTYLYMNTRLGYVSYRWAWFSTNGRLVGSVGPALFYVQHLRSLIRPGLHINGQYRFVNRRTWLLAAKVDARWGLPTSTGNYETTQYNFSPTGNQQKILTFLSLTLSTFQVDASFQFGLKF